MVSGTLGADDQGTLGRAYSYTSKGAYDAVQGDLLLML